PIFESGTLTRVPHSLHTTATCVTFGFSRGGGGASRFGSTRLSGFRGRGGGSGSCDPCDPDSASDFGPWTLDVGLSPGFSCAGSVTAAAEVESSGTSSSCGAAALRPPVSAV